MNRRQKLALLLIALILKVEEVIDKIKKKILRRR